MSKEATDLSYVRLTSVADSVRGLAGDRRPAGYPRAVNERLGPANSLEQFRSNARFVDYESTRAAFEAWNTRPRQDADGLLARTSHTAWRSAVWQSYDHDPDVNGGFHGARKGCEPLHVQADPVRWRVVAVNHTASAIEGATVTARLHDLNGRPLGPRRRQGLDVAASSTADAFSVPFDGSLPALHLLRLCLADAHGTVVSTNDYWRYRSATDMRALTGLPHVRLSVRVRPAGSAAATAVVRNTGPSVAAMVRVSLRDRLAGDRVLPARYGDNYLWLLPGESRETEVSWRPSTGPVHPRVAVDGFNSSPVSAC